MTQIDTLIELCRSGEFYKDYDGSTELLRLAKEEADALRKQLEEAHQSILRHFNEEHLAGDGPEIDRWKAKNRTLTEEVERLRALLLDVVSIFPQRQAMMPTIRKIKAALTQSGGA